MDCSAHLPPSGDTELREQLEQRQQRAADRLEGLRRANAMFGEDEDDDIMGRIFNSLTGKKINIYTDISNNDYIPVSTSTLISPRINIIIIIVINVINYSSLLAHVE